MRPDSTTLATPAATLVPASAEPHLYARHVNPFLADLLGRLKLDKRFVRGQGCYLYDDTGRRYLDCIAAYGALPFGFNPRPIWSALRAVERSGEPSFVQPSLLDGAGELAARLAALAPGNMPFVTFANSGAEAVEAAIKLCRAATGRRGVLSTGNSFHGKTLGALSATGNPEYQDAFGVPGADFDKIPYGDVEALRQAFAARPGHYAALLLEPIQGEGGIVEAPVGYLAAARALCDEAGVLLVFDEIQTGLGRTGRLFACEEEGVTPDVMTLAKALGGGLVPIGAVLCTEAAYSEAFARKHSSTFAGNALACRAGLASLDLLTREDGKLLRRVRRNGRRLKARLEKLRQRYPHLLAEVRGRGYMLGLCFEVDRDTWPDSVLGTAAEQNLFTPIFSAYLLNVEGVRVAPTLNGKAVVRIEPALTFTWAQCEELLGALERALEAFSDGDTGRILGAILDGAPRPASALTSTLRLAVRPEVDEPRFGFLMHPMDVASYANFDPSLQSLSPEDLEQVAARLSGLVEPFVLSKARVVSRMGRSAYGEFVIVPRTAQELSDMPREQAVAEVRAALNVAKNRGAQMVGLGAFTSVVTRGGLSLARDGVAITTGNSYTTVACAQAVGMALERLGATFGSHLTAAVVGATGAIGRAMSLLIAENVGRFVLLGNPDSSSDIVRKRLLNVAADICRHLAACRSEGRRFLPGTLAETLAGIEPNASDETIAQAIQTWETEGRLVLSQELAAVLPQADVVVAATSATGSLIRPINLKAGAVVCDLSKPANVSEEVAASRPDVLVIDGGIIAVPGLPFLGRFGLDVGHSFACMAETMLLTLDGHFRNTSLGTDLAPETLRQLQASAERHGFRVARLRSFGRILADADWNNVLAARKRA